MKNNIKYISELSGCSPATVSNVLNHKKGVSRETAERVLRIAREVGYLNEARMTGVRLVVYTKSGTVLSDTPFFSALIEGIERECRANRLTMTVVNLNRNSPDFEQLLEQILTDWSSGILLLATELDQADVEPFARATAPVVVLDSWFDRYDFDTVLINNTDSVCNAVEYFIKNGHRRIGYLGSSVYINNFYYREMGYLRAMARHELPVEERWQVRLSPTMDGAYRDMKEYLSTNPELPTAYFSDNDIIAFGAMKALREAGYKIPQDISIIGFDDMPFCEIVSPPLTTIRVFKGEMGQTAVRRMVQKSKETGSKVHLKMQICTEFVERDSVRRLE